MRDLRRIVFQGKIPVTATLFPKVRDFALDPQPAHFRLDRALHLPDKLRHGKRFGFLFRNVGEEVHLREN